VSGRRGAGGDHVAPYELDPGSYNEPVTARDAWLKAHPGGSIGYQQGTLYVVARIGEDVIASAYDDLRLLMRRAAEAETAGACPLHPPAVPS
jgi:hypothetical protein